MRAIEKVADYLLEDQFYTGDEDTDKDTKMAVRQLLKQIKLVEPAEMEFPYLNFLLPLQSFQESFRREKTVQGQLNRNEDIEIWICASFPQYFANNELCRLW